MFYKPGAVFVLLRLLMALRSAVDVLSAGLPRELHYWVLVGPQAAR